MQDPNSVQSSIELAYEEIYADSKVTPGEVIQLRKLVDTAEASLLEAKGEYGITSASLKSFEVTRQLIQECLLEARKAKDTENLRKLVDVIQANINLLQVNLDAFA